MPQKQDIGYNASLLIQIFHVVRGIEIFGQSSSIRAPICILWKMYGKQDVHSIKLKIFHQSCDKQVNPRKKSGTRAKNKI